MTPKFMIGEDVSDLDLGNLLDFIENDFHAYFAESLPVIDTQFQAATRVDSEIQELVHAYESFRSFKDALTQHIGEEKHIAFPIIQQLINDLPVDSLNQDTIHKIFKNIELEHQQINRALIAVEKYTGDFNAPVDSSPTLKECFDKLKQLNHNYTIYLFIEINYLYPKLNALKQELIN